MDRGFVKLWRCSLDSQVWRNEGLWRVWCWCLMKAAHEQTWVPISTGVGNTEVKLEPGQFIFGRKSAAKSLRIPEGTIRKRMEKLKNIGNLTMQPATHFTIVTICNWEIYQAKPDHKGHPKGQAGTTQGPPRGHKEELKELKEEYTVPDPPLKDAIPYTKIISFLNEKSGRSFKPNTRATQLKIRARFNDGFSEDDFYTVIEKKISDWSGNLEMENFIRPETLFGNKFEGYLQSAKANGSKAKTLDFMQGAI